MSSSSSSLDSAQQWKAVKVRRYKESGDDQTSWSDLSNQKSTVPSPLDTTMSYSGLAASAMLKGSATLKVGTCTPQIDVI